MLKKKMTEIKNREAWIPIAPSVMAEHGHEYFFDFTNSPFMTRVYNAKSSTQHDLSAVLHVDGTARAQAVDKHFYPPFRKLLERFYAMTGVPMILNTSLNRHAEPIVHHPKDAINMLLHTDMDVLVIGSFALQKSKKH
jgi:carbamoyltransferase